MKAVNVVAGVVVSLVAGATLGVLFAPQKGLRTRRFIADRKDDFSDALKDKFNDFVEVISTQFERVYNDTEKTIRNEKPSFEAGKQIAKSMVS